MPGRFWAALAALAAVAPGLCGCTPVAELDRAHVCRIAAVALAPSHAPDIRQTITAQPDGTTEVRIDLAGGAARGKFVTCTFAPHDAQDGRPDLTRVETEAGPLSEPRLVILRRFWIATPEGAMSDPEPVGGAHRAVRVPFAAAYGGQVLLNALPAVASYGLLAAAYSLVYGLIGRVNLAFGQMAAVGGAAALAGAAILGRSGVGPLVAATLAAAMWAGSLHGAVVGRWVFQPLRRSTAQQGLVATVGLALVLDEYLRLAGGPAPAYIAPLRTAPLALARSGDFVVTVTPLAIVLATGFLVAAGGVLLLLGRSQYGRNWRAIADDPGAAALLGVDPLRMLVTTFALASSLAAASGAAVVLVYGSFGASLGTTLGLKALLAAVLGGIGSVRGAFLGGVALGLIEAGWSAVYSIDTRDLATFVVLAVALVARPGGLLGYPELAPRRV